MKRLLYILIAALAICLCLPGVSLAQSGTVTIGGSVFQGGNLPAYGATVQLYTWDGSNMGTTPLATARTDENGRFSFGEQTVDLSTPFPYAVKASVDQFSGYALVYVTQSAGSQRLVAAPISIDISSPSGTGKLTGHVQSGSSIPVGEAIPNATVTLYRKGSSGAVTKVGGITNPVTTDSKGKFEFAALPYGLYAIEATKGTMGNSVNTTIYQQESKVTVKLTDTGIPYSPIVATIATPTATVAPSPAASDTTAPTLRPPPVPSGVQPPAVTAQPTRVPTPVAKKPILPCCPAALLPLLLVGTVAIGIVRRRKN